MSSTIGTTGIRVITTDQYQWNYSIPLSTDSKVNLLTVGRIATNGSWYGSYGQFFIAWAPLPKIDQAVLDWISKNQDTVSKVRSIHRNGKELNIHLIDGSTIVVEA